MQKHSILQGRYFWLICLVFLWMLAGLGVSAAERKAIDVDSSKFGFKGVVLDDGSLWVWDYDDVYFSKPKKITDNVKQMDLGYQHGAAIKTDGSLWTWGYNFDGQLGNGSTNGSSDLFFQRTHCQKLWIMWCRYRAVNTIRQQYRQMEASGSGEETLQDR